MIQIAFVRLVHAWGRASVCRKYWFKGYRPKSQGGTKFSGELIMYYRSRVVHCDSFERNKQFAPINPDFRQELSCGLLQLRLISGGWIRVVADSVLRPNRDPAAGYDLRLSRVPSAGFKSQLSRVPAVGYKLGLTPSYGWILPLTRVPVAGYKLLLSQVPPNGY